MRFLLDCLWVGAAGFCGAIARFAVARVSGQLFRTSVPVGTLLINVSGSFALGWLLVWLKGRGPPMSDALRLAIGVGFLGAYTTFSTFTYESSRLWDDGEMIKATAYVVGSVALGLLAVRFGMSLASR
jgi:CrcB protein